MGSWREVFRFILPEAAEGRPRPGGRGPALCFPLGPRRPCPCAHAVLGPGLCSAACLLGVLDEVPAAALGWWPQAAQWEREEVHPSPVQGQVRAGDQGHRLKPRAAGLRALQRLWGDLSTAFSSFSGCQCPLTCGHISLFSASTATPISSLLSTWNFRLSPS